MSEYYFTSESVTEGHPDKVCDAISDAILDNLLEQDSESRVACETLATKEMVVVAGEITTDGFVDVDRIVKNTLNEIGYDDYTKGMNQETVKVISAIQPQSKEISQGVSQGNDEEQGAGDQGLMFGFACKETPELMPLPIQMAHRLTEKLTELRKDGTLSWLRPDGKSQVSVKYVDGQPTSISQVVIATQHEDMLGKFGTEEAENAFVKRSNSAYHFTRFR